MNDVVFCRCGKPAPLDVSISAAPPFDVAATAPKRTELHFSTVACRDCAFEAAKLMLAFLQSQGKPS